MSGIPGPPGGADDFSKRIAAAQSKLKSGTGGAQFRPVNSGGSLSQIASESGLSEDEIWQHPLNKQLRERRGSPTELKPGDAVYVPEASQEQEAEESGGPVGQGDYIVKEGDCISSIAKDHGLLWETIWNDPANAELKEVRKNPNILLVGDRVTIPEKTRKDESIAPEQRHRFVRQGEPAMLRLKIVEAQSSKEQEEGQQGEQHEDQPKSGIPYLLKVESFEHRGTTESDGKLEVTIPPSADRGKLILWPDTEQEQVINLRLGQLSPISELWGMAERLANLGFRCNERPREMTEALSEALRAFQGMHDLEVTGEPDDETRNKLVEVHGS